MKKNTAAIFQMTNATGSRKDKWKTYYYDNGKRKEIVRNSLEEIYDALYELKDSISQYLRRSCNKLGIDITNNHAFRHALNYRMINSGLSSAERALILGQKVSTNERYYSHTDKRALKSIRSRLFGADDAAEGKKHSADTQSQRNESGVSAMKNSVF